MGQNLRVGAGREGRRICVVTGARGGGGEVARKPGVRVSEQGNKDHLEKQRPKVWVGAVWLGVHP